MNRTDIRDHENNKFKSIDEMCHFWHIAPTTFYRRKSEGMSLKDCLTAPSKTHKRVHDHLGNEFTSARQMCKHWNMPYSTYYNRIFKLNMSVKDALTIPVNSQNTVGKDCIDHLGNEYPSIEAMCCKYGIMRNTFYSRRKKGWSLEKTLTTPLCRKNGAGAAVKDHLGNKYQNVAQMCDAYGLTFCQYGSRIRAGWSLEKTLTTPAEEIPIQRKECVDHLGNVWPSQAQMCKHYGVTKDQLRSRVELGWTLERILTNPEQLKHSQECHDHLGNKYDSIEKMYQHYGISPQIVKRRMEKLGMSFADALTAKNLHNVQCEDHEGNRFNTLQDMRTYWCCGSSYHHRRKKLHWDMKKTLTTIPYRYPKKFSKYIDNIKPVNDDYYMVIYKHNKYVWHINTLMNIYRKENCEITVSDDGAINCRYINENVNKRGERS